MIIIKNRYPKKCYSCRTMVEVGEGFAFKEGGIWMTACQEHKPEVNRSTVVVKEARKIEEDGTIRMPYEPENLPLIKSLPRARWNPTLKVWTVSVEYKDLPRVLEVADRIGLKVPASLRKRGEKKTEQAAKADERLFPFQVDGVDFLARHDTALMGDEMGLGKTVQVASALRGQDYPVVVICPNSLKFNWRNELEKWAPEYKVTILSGRKSFRFPENGEVVIINYDILSDLEKDTTGPEGLTLVCDEVQYAKNYKAKRTQRVTALARIATRVWALTGTPLMNRPFDLYGVLSSTNLNGEVFGYGKYGFEKFLKLFNAFHDGYAYQFGMPSPEVPERLRRVMIRRKREEVLPDLPSKIHTNVEINGISKSLQRKLDKQMDIIDLELGSLPDFEEFSEIRAMLAKERIPALLEMVESYEDSDTPLVVFSAHRAPIDALDEREGWATITGSTKPERRQEIVDAFQKGMLKGVGLTIAAGGTGLTLTHASHMIFVDLDWVPANNAQAEDRCVRIGQMANSVNIIRMVSTHALDQHIHNILTYKIDLAFRSVDASVNSKKKRETKVITTQEVKVAPRVVEVDPKFVKAVAEGLQMLASVCDGTIERDQCGFNKPDSKMGHTLAMVAGAGNLTDNQAIFAGNMIRKYRRQLPDNVNEIIFNYFN